MNAWRNLDRDSFARQTSADAARSQQHFDPVQNAQMVAENIVRHGNTSVGDPNAGPRHWQSIQPQDAQTMNSGLLKAVNDNNAGVQSDAEARYPFLRQ